MGSCFRVEGVGVRANLGIGGAHGAGSSYSPRSLTTPTPTSVRTCSSATVPAASPHPPDEASTVTPPPTPEEAPSPVEGGQGTLPTRSPTRVACWVESGRPTVPGRLRVEGLGCRVWGVGCRM